MGDLARRVSLLVGIGILIGYGSSIGTEWGSRRAEFDHMNSAVVAMTSDVSAMRTDAADDREAMRRDIAADMATMRKEAAADRAAIRKDVAEVMIAIGNLKGRIHGASLPWPSRIFASTEPEPQDAE